MFSDKSKILITIKIIGWLPVAGCFIIMTAVSFAAIIQLPQGDAPIIFRALELIVPLAFSLHSAFLLSSENDHPLELLLSLPETLQKLLINRFFVACIMYSAMALVFTIIALFVEDFEGFWITILRWLASGIFLGGTAVFTSQLTRQARLGVLAVSFIWVADITAGDLLVHNLPWLRFLRVHLQPQNIAISDYLLNRAVLIIVGVALTFFALLFMSDDDRMLGIK